MLPRGAPRGRRARRKRRRHPRGSRARPRRARAAVASPIRDRSRSRRTRSALPQMRDHAVAQIRSRGGNARRLSRTATPGQGCPSLVFQRGRRELVLDDHTVACPHFADAPAGRVVEVSHHAHVVENTIAAMSAPGIFRPPAAVNEPVKSYDPARPNGSSSGAARADGRRARPHPDGDRRRAGRDGDHIRSRHASSPLARARRCRKGGAARGRACDRSGARRPPGLVADAVARAGRNVPPRRRADRRAVALDDQRRHDAEPVEDGLSGRDRRSLRDDRLPPLQRRVPRADLRGAADLVAGRRGTGWSTGRSRASCSRSARSTSPRSGRT